MRRINERKNNRLPSYDYSTPGWYFVTICVQDMECALGEISNGKMVLNGMGRVVEKQWLWLKENFIYVDLDEFVIMPNHIHGILIINNVVGTTLGLSQAIEPDNRTSRGLSLHDRKFNLLSKTINAFKTTSSKKIHQSGINFIWQRSFYDHIIDFEKNELENIREYIKNNPAKWEWDRENNNSIWY